jgi:polar amino acid transport system substrate-binding protein
MRVQDRAAADAADLLRSGKASVFGYSGVGYPAAAALTGAKIVPGAFRGRCSGGRIAERPLSGGARSSDKMLDEAKQAGVIQKAIESKGLKGVNVATK